MPNKYAPPNEAGEKPYVVEVFDWGKRYFKTVYAKTANDAKYAAIGRGRVGVGVHGVRRATHDDLNPSRESDGNG